VVVKKSERLRRKSALDDDAENDNGDHGKDAGDVDDTDAKDGVDAE
jgi:hypothetical protein